jgi:hypothetical protein
MSVTISIECKKCGHGIGLYDSLHAMDIFSPNVRFKCPFCGTYLISNKRRIPSVLSVNLLTVLLGSLIGVIGTMIFGRSHSLFFLCSMILMLPALFWTLFWLFASNFCRYEIDPQQQESAHR